MLSNWQLYFHCRLEWAFFFFFFLEGEDFEIIVLGEQCITAHI